MADFRTVLLDLDGTIIDHFNVIHRCYNYALDQLGLELVSYEAVRAAVGGSIRITFGKLIPAEHVDAAIVHYRAHFKAIWAEDIIELSGARWLLQQLCSHGYQAAVLTNKEADSSRDLLHHVGFDAYLEGIFGTMEGPYRKPQPEFTAQALQQLGATPEKTILIGDSPYDFQTAQNGQLAACYLVGTGSHTVEQLQAETTASGIYPDLDALAQAVFGWSRP